MFDFLIGPAVTALAVLGLAAATDTRTVHIGDISAPDRLVQAGYTPEVLEERLIEAMRVIEADARSHAPSRAITTEHQETVRSVVGDALGVTGFVRVAQRAAGLIAFALDGSIVEKGDRLELTLAGRSADGGRVLVRRESSADDVDALIGAAALAAMEAIDPYARAAWQFRQDAAARDFAETLRLLDVAEKTEGGRDRMWLENLRGMALHLLGRSEDALAAFDRALLADGAFTPARLNRGVTLASAGRHVEAIAEYRKVLEADPPHDAAAVHAAAYSEWAVSLAALGLVDKAFEAFRHALTVDPAYADAYANWAAVLAVLGRTDEAAALRRRMAALGAGDALLVEFLVGRLGSDAAALVQPKG